MNLVERILLALFELLLADLNPLLPSKARVFLLNLR